MGIAYDIAYTAAAAISCPFWGYRLLRTGKWRTDWAGRFGKGLTFNQNTAKPTLLLHAVSVGEVNAIRQLVARFEREHPDVQLIISVTTDTGFARATELFAQQHTVVRYPLDFSRSVARFLDRVQPTVVALTELEVWPNFVRACEKRNIPVCVINGRLSAGSYKGYRKAVCVLRSTFARLAAAAVQTPDYAQRFVGMGVPADRVRVLDTMKWDTARIADDVPGSDELAAAMGIDRGKPIVVAGSTGPGEEKLLIEQCPADAQLILVPRKPERFDEVAALAPEMVRRSQCQSGSRQTGGRLFLVDTMGELGKAYALADVAVVGRSFVPMGGSDPIEPAGLGKPVIIGQHHDNFADVVSAFAQTDGIVITDAPGQAIADLLADADKRASLAKAGRDVIRGRQGATQRHATMLMNLLNRKPAFARD